MSEMHSLPKPMPGGSSLFASVMSDINAPPVVKISAPDEMDGHNHTLPSDAPNPSDEGKEIHGLQCCYKIENGKYVVNLSCHHDHSRLSHGHMDEIAVGASNIGMKNSVRRRSITNLDPALEEFRSRSGSNSSQGRRGSLQPGLRPGSSSPSSRRRASIGVPKSPSGSPSGSPQSKSPQRSSNGSRRGSNVSINADDLHHVYEQMNLKERKK